MEHSVERLEEKYDYLRGLYEELQEEIAEGTEDWLRATARFEEIADILKEVKTDILKLTRRLDSIPCSAEDVPVATKFKVGDWVRLVHIDRDSTKERNGLKTGMEGTVIEVYALDVYSVCPTACLVMFKDGRLVEVPVSKLSLV